MLKGFMNKLILIDDFFPGLTRALGKDIIHAMEVQNSMERAINSPPTDQRLVHNLVSEVVNPKTKRNAAQWKKEQKMRRK